MKLPAWTDRLAFWRRPERPPRPVPGTRTVVLASLPVGVVATIAGIVSYSHIAALGLRTHQGAGDSHLLPFAVDFLIVAGSVVLLAGYWLGWLCVAAGVAGTLFANLEFGLPYGWLAAIVSTWPAVAFTVVTFVLERWLRSRREQPGEPREALPGKVSAPLFTDAQSAAAWALARSLEGGNRLSDNQLRTRFRLSRTEQTEVCQLVLAGANGHAPEGPEDEQP